MDGFLAFPELASEALSLDPKADESLAFCTTAGTFELDGRLALADSPEGLFPIALPCYKKNHGKTLNE